MSALAKVQIARKELGLDDDTYRAMLERITGRRSARDCSDQQLGQVLDEMKAKGWTPKVFVSSGNKQAKPKGPGRRAADSPVAKKARAMWISLHQLGAVRDPSDRALEAFARRQLHVEAMQWMDQGLSYKLIEALKAMAERAGWSQDLTGIRPQDQVLVLKLSLAEAMRLKLGYAWAMVTAETVAYVIDKYAREIREAQG